MGESKQHLRQKERIRDLARAKGLVAENEIGFWCWSGYHNKPICYYADIFFIGQKVSPTIVELDGPVGHGSKYQSKRDNRRSRDIRDTWGDNIKVHRFTLAELKIASDEEILEDLEL